MRAAFIVSALMHALILAAAVITLPDADGFSTAPVAALPVELVSIDELTDLSIGDVRETEVVEDAAERTVETELEPVDLPGATGEDADRSAADEAARANADASSSPEPAADEAPAEETAEVPEPADTADAAPELEPAAEPEPAETEVAALEPQPAPQPAAEAPPAPRVPETVVPQRKPPPPPRRRQEARQQPSEPDAFNADRLSQLINRTDPSGGGAGASQASLGASDGRASAALTLSEMDALRSQMQRCWNPPIGLAGAQELVVAVQIRLLPDGSVDEITNIGQPGVGALYDVAADAARRAVIQCQPYRLPPQKYETWKDVQVTFDPRELF